jgi:hypothetical protein
MADNLLVRGALGAGYGMTEVVITVNTGTGLDSGQTRTCGHGSFGASSKLQSTTVEFLGGTMSAQAYLMAALSQYLRCMVKEKSLRG